MKGTPTRALIVTAKPNDDGWQKGNGTTKTVSHEGQAVSVKFPKFSAIVCTIQLKVVPLHP